MQENKETYASVYKTVFATTNQVQGLAESTGNFQRV